MILEVADEASSGLLGEAIRRTTRLVALNHLARTRTLPRRECVGTCSLEE